MLRVIRSGVPARKCDMLLHTRDAGLPRQTVTAATKIFYLSDDDDNKMHRSFRDLRMRNQHECLHDRGNDNNPSSTNAHHQLVYFENNNKNNDAQL